MPCTAIQVTKGDVIIKSKIITVSQGGHTDVDVYKCNDEFIPIGEPAINVSDMEESYYHIYLRKEADSRGQYIREESTNPEWNPENQVAHDAEIIPPHESI